MIIIKHSAYTREEIDQLKEQFDVYIKTVIDLDTSICCAGCDRHADCEKLLLEQGSNQSSLWGGGIDLATNVIDCNSMINIRPRENNRSNEIQDPNKRAEFEIKTKSFFKEIL